MDFAVFYATFENPTVNMNNGHFFRRATSICCHVILIVCLGLVMASCKQKGKMQGTYGSSIQSYTFDGDTATVIIMSHQVGDKWSYTVEGNKVILTGPGGTVELTMNEDGSL